LDLVGDRWTLLVMRDVLFYGKRRFADFLTSPEAIATNILAERLAREEYFPTGRGRDLAPAMREMIRWGQRHIPGTAKRPPPTMSEQAVRFLRGDGPFKR